ncbi:hypothetical protein JCM3775_006597 [Rhodotorula graminis]
MRDPTSPDTLTARLAALRSAAHPAAAAPSSPPPPAAPTSPTPDADDDDTAQLAERLARLRAPAAASSPSSSGESSSAAAGPRVPVGFKGVDELDGSAHEDDEVERFLRRVEEEERVGAGEQLSEDDDLVKAILRSRSPRSGPLDRLPSPPSSPPLARAPRRSIPSAARAASLSPSLLDTLSGVEVQFFRPGPGIGDDAPSPVEAGELALALGGPAGGRLSEEEEELMRRVRDEGEVELRQGTADREDDEDTARGWEARLAGLGGTGAAPSGRAGGGGGAAALGPGAAPAREGVDEVRRAARRRARKEKGRSGSGSEEEESEEETESSEEEDSADGSE